MADTLEPKKLLLQSAKPLELQPMEKNHVKQMFVPGKGEVVARFNNFERDKKYFAFLIEETDAEGSPLHRTPEEDNKAKIPARKINGAFAVAAELVDTAAVEGADIPAFIEAMKAKLEELKGLVSR